MPWLVLFALPEVAVALDALVCVTGPSFPGLSTRITMFTFVGAAAVEVALVLASCVVGAVWLAVCDSPVEAGESPVAGGALDWSCAALCSVVLLLPAVPELEDALSCRALPPVETFVGCWLDVATALALCCVGALWTVD